MRTENSTNRKEMVEAILLHILKGQKSYGNEMTNSILESHLWSITRQAVYSHLKTLEQSDFVKGYATEKNQKIYEITRNGIARLKVILGNLKTGFEFKNSQTSLAIMSDNETFLIRQKLSLTLLYEETKISLIGTKQEKAKILIQHDLDQIKAEIKAINKSLEIIERDKLMR